MAEAKPIIFSMVYLIALVFVLNVSHGVHGHDDEKVFNLQSFLWKQLSTGISGCHFQKPKSNEGATIFEMKHRNHCWGKKTVDWNRKQQQRLIRDELHVRSLQSRFRNMISATTQDVSETQIPLKPGAGLQTLNYVVKMELGGQNMTVVVDTGSDLTWVQCEPCKLCYRQQDPIYDPSHSHSYQTVSCNSSICQSQQNAIGYPANCARNTSACNYIVNYGDGSFTRGDLGRDDLRLGTTLVKDFVFGCGRYNKGLFGEASGLMGLGRSNVSLVSQTSGVFGGVFSYCLPSTEEHQETSGSLAFGAETSMYKNSTPISYTTMIQYPELSSFYFLNLTGISVGGKGLKVPSFGKRILIDSGTIITRLAPSVYKALKAEFLRQFSGFPKSPGYSILDTCFNLTDYQESEVPTIKFQFEGNAEFPVVTKGLFYKVDSSQVCLALASLHYEEEIAIIGNYQQKNLRVIYDTKHGKVGFAAETCSFM